jgi:hypothetical protein
VESNPRFSHSQAQGRGFEPGVGHFFGRKKNFSQVDQPRSGVSWGDVPTSFASSPSSIGPILELFTFLAPRPSGPPRPPHKPCISLISLWTRVKSLICGFEPGGVWDRTQVGHFFRPKKSNPEGRPTECGGGLGGCSCVICFIPEPDRTEPRTFHFFGPPTPSGPPGHPISLITLCISL